MQIVVIATKTWTYRVMLKLTFHCRTGINVYILCTTRVYSSKVWTNTSRLYGPEHFVNQAPVTFEIIMRKSKRTVVVEFIYLYDMISEYLCEYNTSISNVLHCIWYEDHPWLLNPRQSNCVKNDDWSACRKIWKRQINGLYWWPVENPYRTVQEIIKIKRFIDYYWLRKYMYVSDIAARPFFKCRSINCL